MTDRLAFHLFGATVDAARALEKEGEIDRVRVSAATYSLLEEDHYKSAHLSKEERAGEEDAYFVTPWYKLLNKEAKSPGKPKS